MGSNLFNGVSSLCHADGYAGLVVFFGWISAFDAARFCVHAGGGFGQQRQPMNFGGGFGNQQQMAPNLTQQRFSGY